MEKQKTTDNVRSMPNQRSNAQRPSLTPSHDIRQLQSEMAQLTAHIAWFTAQQMTPAPRNPTPPTQQLVHVQKAGNRPSGTHLQTCSFHGRCTHNDASCRAQCFNSARPGDAAAAHISHCYFCPTRAHPTD
uniref:Uncharacterized protein n=1 Tax=Romanomermis culicivorax TaxID=13658 RepID=A0A915J0I7_ROMCU